MSLASSSISISWSEIEQDTEHLADLVRAKGNWTGLVAVSRGGLVPASIVANLLGLQNVEMLSVASYVGQERCEPRIIRMPSVPDEGEGWLIVDDLVDSGHTMKLARELFPKAHIAVLYAKPKGRELAHTFVREFPQTCWLNFPWEKTFSPVR